MTAAGRRGVHVRAVGVFLLVSFGAALLLDCVVTATGGLGTPQAKVILTLRMFTPALAAWVVCRFITHESWLRESGLARRPPGSGGRLGWLRILGFATIFIGYLTDFVEASQYVVIAIIVPFAALGWYRPRGLPFEKYAGYIINHQRSRQLYVYGMISQVQPSADGGPVPRKAKRNHKKTRSRRKGSLPVERDSYV